MIITSDYITPAELTGYVREAVANLDINRFVLSQWLPSRAIDDLVYRFTQGGEGLVDAATFRAYDAESPIGARPGATRVTGELPPISRKIRLGEYDRLRQRNAPAPQFVQGILDDAERMARAIAARIELARGDALTNGSITLSENGVITGAISFGRSGSHTVTAGTLWSTVATATPISDLTAWQTTYIASNGEPPGVLVGSTTIKGYLLQNAQIRTLAGSLAGTPALVSEDQMQAVLRAFGLPPFITYDAQVRVAGSATRTVPVNKLLMLPAPTGSPDGTDLGATLYGVTAESLEADYGLAGTEPGVVAGSYKTNDPVSIWTKAAAIALPVLANPNLSFTATVA
jgi:Phage major capsid protein E